jgi:HEPN domain-containing protein
MAEARHELVRAWLTKATHDLDTARQISGLPDGHLDAAIYHCQQAAEKALKGFIAYHEHDIERTHDLKRLVQMAAADEAVFAQWMHAASLLTPYAAAYRYPEESAVLEPDREEFDEALQAAAGLVEFVLSRLPAGARPAATPGA